MAKALAELVKAIRVLVHKIRFLLPLENLTPCLAVRMGFLGSQRLLIYVLKALTKPT
jgi:hypothetical protein